MRTTIDIPDALLDRARVALAERRMTLRTVVITALERLLETPESRFVLRDAAAGYEPAGDPERRVDSATINAAIDDPRALALIAVDTNILVHAHQREADLHPAAAKLIRQLAEGVVPWAICLHSLVELYGVVTAPRLWRSPSSPEQALEQITAWRESPTLVVLSDDARMLSVLAELAAASQVRGAKVHDARIASCCLVHGIDTLYTVDRDFSRFPQLKTRNPLAP